MTRSKTRLQDIAPAIISGAGLAMLVLFIWAYRADATDKGTVDGHGSQSTKVQIGSTEQAEITYAQPAAFQDFDPRQVGRWFSDLVFAPGRARDRQIVHAYDVEDLTTEDLRTFFESSSNCHIALINRPTDGGILLVGGEHAYWGAPITVISINQTPKDGQRPLKGSRFLKDELASVVAFSSLQASGVHPTRKENVVIDPQTRTYIASAVGCISIDKPGVWRLVTNKAAWAAIRK